AYADQIRNPFLTLRELTTMVHEVTKDDPTWKKYWDVLLNGLRRAAKEREKIGEKGSLEEPQIIVKYLNLLEESFKEAEKEAGIEPFWHKTPEEILGLREALPAPYSSYREWLVEFLSSTLRSMDPRELAELIVSCCGGECIYREITRHGKG
ncbi:MAG: hypothetical protein GSR73_02250, partial [Desulfurococcales archaeon]|nr:hypothetical protein [Desulfurococcales archaeon]